jgi:hypothetical protein
MTKLVDTYHRWRPRLSAWLISGLVSFTLASIAHTQTVLNRLSELGVALPISTRIETTVIDWLGLATGYLPIILLGLSLGFSIMGFVNRWLRWPHTLVFGIAGAIALFAIHSLMFPIFNVTLIAGARSAFGMSLQIMAGLIGGVIYAHLRNKRSA